MNETDGGTNQKRSSLGRRMRAGLRGLVVALMAQLGAGAAAAGPAVGEAAPAFTLPGTDGKDHTLGELLGERDGVVLAWFPKAFTPG